MAERRVNLADIAILDAFAFQEGAQDLVGGARIDIVRAQQHEALGAAAILAHQVLHGRDRLLVRRGARIKHILFQFLALVLHGIEQQAVEFLKHGQDRLARHGRPAAEDDGDFILRHQLARLFREERPVRRRVDDDGLQLLAQHATLGIDFGDRHQGHVFQRRFRNGHGARQGVQDAHLDGVGSPGCLHTGGGGEGQCACGCRFQDDASCHGDSCVRFLGIGLQHAILIKQNACQAWQAARQARDERQAQGDNGARLPCFGAPAPFSGE